MSETFAVLGLFDSAEALAAAAARLKDQRLGRLEAYTPYPVHGMADLLGHRRSPLAGMVMVMGILGALTALGFQMWVAAVDYPLVTGGKAPTSWQAFVPIMFEVTVLFASLTAGLGMLLLLNSLPFFGHPVLHSKAIRDITRDRFALAVEAPGGKPASTPPRPRRPWRPRAPGTSSSCPGRGQGRPSPPPSSRGPWPASPAPAWSRGWSCTERCR